MEYQDLKDIFRLYQCSSQEKTTRLRNSVFQYDLATSSTGIVQYNITNATEISEIWEMWPHIYKQIWKWQKIHFHSKQT
jgi:hypothetical protein